MLVSRHARRALAAALGLLASGIARNVHAAALANGGASDGAPGLRPHDGANGYYAAFIRDPDGNRLEAVTFVPK